MKRYFPRPNKTIIIVLIITAILLNLSSNFWNIKNFTLHFTATSAKKVDYEVLYTTHSSQLFNTASHINGTINAGTSQQDITIDTAKLNTIRLKFAPSNNSITLSNITLCGKKQNSINNFEDFKYTDILNKHSNKDDLTFTTSSKNSAAITIEFPKTIKGQNNIDVYIFTILATIYFFISYKLVKYLATFKLEGHYSRIDIVFLSLFFTAIFIPMWNISDQETSQNENRTLAARPTLKAIYDKSQNYGQQFEQWFNDHFYSREKIIRFHDYIQRSITKRGNDKVLIGKDNWLFYTLENSINNFKNTSTFSDKELENIAQYLSDINNWAKQHGKEFYYLICPDKNKIYGENIQGIKKEKPDSQSRINQLVNYLHQHTQVKVIYLYDVIHQAKKESDNLLYWKNDTHWTPYGAYIGYLELMHQINQGRKQPFKVLKDLPLYEAKHPSGDLNKLYPGSEIDNNTTYFYPQINNTETCDHSLDETQDTHCNNPYGKKIVYIYRDSFSANLGPYLNNTFKEVNYKWRYDIKDTDLQELKQGDIIIMEQLERMVPTLSSLTFPKD